MGDWKEYKLGEVADITSSKRIFYSEYVTEGVPFYRSKEVIDKFNKRNIQTELFISEERFKAIKEKYGAPEKDDILLTSVGTLGIPYLVCEKDSFYFKDGNLTWFRKIDKDKVDAKYLFLWLQSSIGQQKLYEVTIGSTQPALTIAGLKEIEIELPDLSEQKSIASVLGSLDDKIDLLHRQNKTLEALAETLFRQWFVEEAEEGWETGKLGEFVKTTSGGTPRRDCPEYYQNGTVRWVKSKELSGSFIFETEEYITEDAINNSSAKLLPENSILIAMYGATVGEYGILAESAACNQAICALIPNNDYPYSFLFTFIKTNKEYIKNLAVGSAQQNVSQILIKDLDVPRPNLRIKEFHKEVDPLFKKIKSNLTQIRTLTRLRDTLLPKLMSGEVRVKE
jgi:type I restriction enzyme S subunit